MKNLFFVVVLLFTMACSPKIAPDQKWPDKKWILSELKGKPVSAGENGEANIQFNVADKTITGSGGCNRIGGPYTMDGEGQLKFGMLISTKMACSNMQTEDGMLASFSLVDSYEMKSGVLRLKKGTEVLMTFK